MNLHEIGIKALSQAFESRNKLSLDGLELVRKNQFGDTALRLDIEAEKTVIEVLKKSGLSLIVHSEEHGVVNIGENPKYLAVLDGIDGSEECKKFWGTGRYGTMLGIFFGKDPKYDDYIFQGIMEHAIGRLVWAGKGTGTHACVRGQTQRVSSSRAEKLDPETKIYFTLKEFDQFGADKTFFVRVLEGHQYTRIGSTASHYVDLCIGDVDLVIEPTRKFNLEPGAAFGLIIESGGEILTEKGERLGNKRFLEFGQDRSLAIIAAATCELARDVVKRL